VWDMKRRIRLFTENWFINQLQAAISQADTRYTPEANVALPIATAFDGLGKTTEFFVAFASLSKECLEKQRLDGLAVGVKSYGVSSAKMLGRVSAGFLDLGQRLESAPRSPFEPVDYEAMKRIIRQNSKIIGPISETLWKLEIERKRRASEVKEASEKAADKPSIRDLLYQIRQLQELLREVDSLISSPAAQLSNVPALLILGGPGIGKTHLLCDVAKARVAKGRPTILVLGQQLPNAKDPMNAIMGRLGIGIDRSRFLRRLNVLARRKCSRVLIFVDAINESDRRSWKRHFGALMAEVAKYPGVGIALSCRTPFERVMVPVRAKVVRVFHEGFHEHELDAQRTYFKRYGLPLPEVPLLTPEFSNPYFLKLFCETLEHAVIKRQHRQIRDIASGQTGMLNIFEAYVKERSSRVARAFGWDRVAIWRLLKEDVAASMVDKHRDSIPLAEVLQILTKYERRSRRRQILLKNLIHEGLLSEDVIFDPVINKAIEAIRFPYQKFSDHLIARHLLKRFFDKKAPAAAFAPDQPLGKLFRDDAAVANDAGIAEALIIELPQRVDNAGELFDYLPERKMPGSAAELFVRGLYWRKPALFNKSTLGWINTLLKHQEIQDRVLDLLLAVSTKPDHPCNAGKLDRFLASFSMVSRDLLWSEFLRKQHEGGSAYRILSWLEAFNTTQLSERQARTYITILKWFLTSTNRLLRDRATRCLYCVGKTYPSLIGTASLDALTLNDPYVPERMLAASYGVAMALHADPAQSMFSKEILPKYAREIFEKIFRRGAPHATTHALIRDFARHTVELAVTIKPDTLNDSEKRLLRPPYRFGGIRKWGRSRDRNKGEYKNGNYPLGMDFRNYTVGWLVPDRDNYEEKHPEYQKVLSNIWWRIYNLGYSLLTFDQVDQLISDRSSLDRNEANATRVDRYGKKYAWIAYYEMFGYRTDKGLLKREWYSGEDERPHDVDIDPSFPDEPHKVKLIDTDFLGDRSQSLQNWVENGTLPDLSPHLLIKRVDREDGPWVLLDGYVRQAAEDIGRSCFIFLRGLLVQNSLCQALLRNLESQNLGGRWLPEIPEYHYIFAGEMPWAETFTPNGTATLQFKTDSLKIGNSERPGEQETQVPTVDVPVALPVCINAWESFHSGVNPGQNSYVPAREIAEALGLWLNLPTWDMRDKAGRRATVCIDWGDKWGDRQKLVFLRRDLLDRFLRDKQMTLVWAVWGERETHYQTREALRSRSEAFVPYKVFQQIYTYGARRPKSLRSPLSFRRLVQDKTHI